MWEIYDRLRLGPKILGVMIMFMAVCLIGLIHVSIASGEPETPTFEIDYEYQWDTPTADYVQQARQARNETRAAAFNAEMKRAVETSLAQVEADSIASEQAAIQEAAQVYQTADTSYSGTSSSSSSGGGSRENRIWIESRGDYSANTGNGYLGAYQFSAQYLEGRMSAAGISYAGVDDFLASSEKQDALADWYAESRYGGWDNVPTSGGW